MVVVAFFALVFVPRFIIEWAWARRVRAIQQSSDIPSTSAVRPLPWLVFVALGLIGAGAAAITLVISRS